MRSPVVWVSLTVFIFVFATTLILSDAFLITQYVSKGAIFPAASQLAPSRIPPGIYLKDADEDRPSGEGHVDEVSDAEALLACWSFLKKTKRVGNWTQLERRKRMKASAEQPFFWEPSELTSSQANIEDDEGELEEGGLRMRPDPNQQVEVWSGEFTSFPIEPTTTRLRRSTAAKKTWQDPDFRNRWYEKRWGKRESRKEGFGQEGKALEARLREIPSSFLSSPELAAMTEQEIAHAIQAYLGGRTKRATSRKKTLLQRKRIREYQSTKTTTGDEPRLHRDSLFLRDEAALKDAQRKRSERAKRAYAKRKLVVAKENLPERKTPSVKQYLPNRPTPQDALLRIENDLDCGILPSKTDVEIIMLPQKLPKRRVLLRRILSEHFNLRGKCVPCKNEDSINAKAFATQCAIHDLGDYVIELLAES